MFALHEKKKILESANPHLLHAGYVNTLKCLLKRLIVCISHLKFNSLKLEILGS